MRFKHTILLCISVAIAGLLLIVAQSTKAQTAASVNVTLTETHFPHTGSCSDMFVAHNLPFATGIRVRDISTYLSNGAGVAANDLDGDGDLDLVFASVDHTSKILWNQGDLTFIAEALDDLYTRGVAIIDVDGDDLLDITFTHRGLEGLSYWRNTGAEGNQADEDARFERLPLPGVDAFAYAQAWGDLNDDGLLDLVTGSYAAELKQRGIDGPMENGSTGVIVHTQQPDSSFTSLVLDPVAETLSLGLVDMTGDNLPEIWVANDFAVRDQVWQHDGIQWSLIEPFTQTSHSTMSLEWGDTRNRDERVYFTTDMKPYDTSPEILAQWQPLMEAMGEHHEEGDPQIMANVLQMPSFRSGFRNQAYWRGVDATGWSWASHFGDLDADGYLDLYVVNGMIATDMFGHLHNGELVEENQAFRNRSSGTFAKAPEWNLGSTASGRGMIMADMDGDGDLDIVVNNLSGSAQLFENQLCTGEHLLVDLSFVESTNSHAIGAQLRLHTSIGVMTRDVRASGGYLSGDPAQVHFGVPTGVEIESLAIDWPDGARSTLELTTMDRHVVITRNQVGD